jgi:adenosylcobinamide kinase/adenosylcobinamide-phosphate guanylyltransferase
MTATIPALTLVTGGARAGKSAYALSLMAPGEPVTYIATAEALDEEMGARIARHRAERPRTWGTIEAPIELAEAVRQAPAADALIIDCLTLWVSNLLLRASNGTGGNEPWYPEAEVRNLVDALRTRRPSIVAVTNEVGLGVVPPTPLGRAYRDALGRVNQQLAEAAVRVLFVVAGIPLLVKAVPDSLNHRTWE